MSFFIGNLSAVILPESTLDEGKSVIGQAGSRIVGHKKRRHERFAVRAGRPVTQLTSNSEAVSSTGFFTGIYTP
jgi:hypothetical protein